jgi:NAD(P)-dependent dehydrogenase (short-subunit alcohol dehydrogenase family)
VHDLAGKVVVITGAVGNLGRAVAEASKQVGAKTVLVDRGAERLELTYRDIARSPDHWLAAGVDLTDAAAVEKMLAEVDRRFGRIDGYVSTVGAFRGGKPAHEEDLANWDFLFATNLRTTLLGSRAVIPYMLPQRSGCIITIASRNALQGTARYAAYSAAKSAVLRLSESMAAELKDSGVRVNCIVPGTIDTPQNRQAMPKADYSKWVDPADIAQVIVFLLSDAARALTGAAIPVYGRS